MTAPILGFGNHRRRSPSAPVGPLGMPVVPLGVQKAPAGGQVASAPAGGESPGAGGVAPGSVPSTASQPALPLGVGGAASRSSVPAMPYSVRVPIQDEEEGLLEGSKKRWGELVADLASPEQRMTLITIGAFVAMLVYSYFPGLTNAYLSWSNPQYSHGWIVPLFSVALLFWWRKPAVFPVSVSARVAGLGLLCASFALRLFVARYRIITIDMYTFVPAVAGVFILVGGWSVFRWAWAPVAFLIFMFPLPDEATRYLLGPLQTLATMASTFGLQTLGLEAYREGNQIVLGEMHLGVVDACSGLRMLTIFIALSVALVLLGKRSWWENGIILASAIPIALTVNVIRITVTGLLYQVANSELAEVVFHDLAGWVMMPMALGMLFLEQYILANVFILESAGAGLVGVGMHGSQSVPLRGRSLPLGAGAAVNGNVPPKESMSNSPTERLNTHE
ncbi:MAG: exosortase/archaeosortase family protein [Planctomycetota bacterium]|nr:MAG: exosortase/archaeosortase family protein [Planctomycetota bacterium]